MDEESLRRIKEQLASGRNVTGEMVAKVLHHCREELDNPKRVLAFYLTKCDADGFDEQGLVEFMYDRLVPYVCSKEDYQTITVDRILRIADVVREAFVDSETTGEAGEVLLYILLESREIVQLYSKMDVKTSGKMAFHGFDAMHVEVGKNFILHFGHAKNYASFSAGLAEALGDVERFKNDPEQRRREIRLVSKNLDEARFGAQSEQIRRMIMPYGEGKENYSESNSIFLGSEWPFMKEVPSEKGATLDSFMVARYSQEIDDVIPKIEKAIDARPEISGLNFLFLILPISDVKEFRLKFLKRVGAI